MVASSATHVHTQSHTHMAAGYTVNFTFISTRKLAAEALYQAENTLTIFDGWWVART